ncbi:MAG: hypothetical protein HYZ57_18485 [Acidobacteria bacterium]|nr:hypothetical protein [Acidobacteriota bacterium]
MPCLLLILILLFPRVAILLLYFFTNFFTGVFDTILIPVLGFLFLPLTLVAYTYFAKSGHPTDAFFLVVMILAVVLDLGLAGGSWRSRRGG